MKNKKLIGLASLMLALGGLAGCSKCEHEWTYKSDAEGHWEVCSKCDEENPDFKKAKHNMVKNPDKEAENKAPTCLEKGWTWQKCKVCGYEAKKEENATGHHFTQKVSTTSTCLVAGKKTMKCKDCDATEEKDDVALGHDFKVDTTYTGEAATCVDAGTAREKCSRCDETRIVDTDPLGHDWAWNNGSAVDGKATVNAATCKNTGCIGKRVEFNATEVNARTKTRSTVIQTAAVEDDPTTADVNEAADAVYEPYYVDNGDESVSFFGRPMNNGIALVNGQSNSDADHTPILDETIYGSFVEYEFTLAADLGSVNLIANMAASSYLGSSGDVFRAGASDWTPGIKKADNTAGYEEMDYRYEVLVDDEVLKWDDSINNAYTTADAKWYTFPTLPVTLNAGAHKLTVRMGGGYLAKFYKFGFETPEALLHHGHVHNFVKDATKSSDPTCNAKGHFYGVCSCGVVDDRDIDQLTHEYEDVPGSIVNATCTADGSKTVKCKLCGDEKTETIKSTGHAFDAGTALPEVADKAKITKFHCDVDDVDRYAIAATDVDADTKAGSDRIKTPAVEDDPATADVNEAADAVYEPNYVDNGDGSVSFWGRARGNKQDLTEDSRTHIAGTSGRPSDIAACYDATVKGSFFEYDFYAPGDLDDVELMMEIKPANYMSSVKMFSAGSGDWTPGLKADPTDKTDATEYEYDVRYIIEFDGNALAQDLTLDCNEAAGSAKKWFKVPLANQFDVKEGNHKLRFTMATGYVCSIYTIAIQTKPAAGGNGGNGGEGGETHTTHEYAPAATPLANSDLREMVCSCGDKKAGEYELKATDCTGENNPTTSNTDSRLGKTNKNDDWEIKGLEAGVYEVYINARTQTNNQDNYWYANDDVSHNNNSDKNGNAKATDFAPRYTLAAGKDADSLRTAVPVGVVDTKYSATNINNTAENWSNVPVATIEVMGSDEVLRLHGNNNGFGIWVFGLRLVKINRADATVGDAVGESHMKAITMDGGLYKGYEVTTEAMTLGQVPDTTNSSTRLGKGTNKSDTWNISGIKAGKYVVYLKGQTKDSDYTQYWNAGDSVKHEASSSGNNGNASAGDIAYRYTLKVGEEAAVNVGLADTTYQAAGINSSAANWTSVAVATINVPADSTTLTLANAGNGYAIYVFGLRLVQVA